MIVSNCNNMLNPLKSLSSMTTSKHLECLFMSFILPHLEYVSLVYSGACRGDLTKLDIIHYRAGILVSGCLFGTNSSKVLRCLGWMSLRDRRQEKLAILMFDYERNLLPSYLIEAINVFRNPHHDARLRQTRQFILPTHMSHDMWQSPIPTAITLWPAIPHEIKSILSRNAFKFKICMFFRGKKNALASTKLRLNRRDEIYLNRTRCDLAFRSHIHSHNFTTVPDPSCACGCRSQTTRHILFHCPLLLEPCRLLFENLFLINNFETIFESLTQINKINTLLFGNEQFSQQVNQKVVSHTAEYVATCSIKLLT
jgi:hypothetical protein